MMKKKTGQRGCLQIRECIHRLVTIFLTVHLPNATCAKRGHLLSHTTSCKASLRGKFLQVRVLLKWEDI